MVIGGLDITDQYIRARQIEPSEFEEGTFKTIRLASGIKAIVGRKKGETSTTVQSVLFDKKRYNKEQATAWLQKHNSKFADAVALEYKKDELFEDDMFISHLQGHLPPLTPSQIEKLLELAGSADEISEEEEEGEEDEDYLEERDPKYSNFNKYIHIE